MTRRLTQEAFLLRCIAIHGTRYDYSRAVYAGKDKKVTIVCTDHGDFAQTPHNHTFLRQGCPTCANDVRVLARRTPLEELLERFKEIHGDRYDYSRIDYTGTHNAVIIICRVHGDFSQTPHTHLEGRGCGHCGRESSRVSRTRDTEDVIAQFREAHGDRYDYSQLEYTVGEKCKIICRFHGPFLQEAGAHRSGQGCPVCGRDTARAHIRLSVEEIISRFREAHGDRYDYSRMNYMGQHMHIEIICPRHGSFLQAPHGHSAGQGCPKCSHRVSRPQAEWISYMSVSYPSVETEVKIGSFFVDGLCDSTALEYHGCYFHGCKHCYPDRDVWNSKCNAPMSALFHKTQQRTQFLEASGYRVIEVWDHEWRQAKSAVVTLQRTFRSKRRARLRQNGPE